MLTEQELKRFFELAHFKGDNPRLRGDAYDYQCDNVLEGADLVESFCWYFRKPKYEIFRHYPSWSSHLGYFLFSLTPEYEEKVRQLIASSEAVP